MNNCQLVHSKNHFFDWSFQREMFLFETKIHCAFFIYLVSGSKDVALTSMCRSDTFSISNQHHMPVLCGTLTGEHIYVDASESCNDLVFAFSTTARGVSTLASRSFSIKITQYACDFVNLAPLGCDQYFYGATAGYIQSFNYQNKKHLALQSQDICIRYNLLESKRFKH